MGQGGCSQGLCALMQRGKHSANIPGVQELAIREGGVMGSAARAVHPSHERLALRNSLRGPGSLSQESGICGVCYWTSATEVSRNQQWMKEKFSVLMLELSALGKRSAACHLFSSHLPFPPEGPRSLWSERQESQGLQLRQHVFGWSHCRVLGGSEAGLLMETALLFKMVRALPCLAFW